MTNNLFSGKTVEEAVKIGLEELGLTRDEAQIEVVEEGKKKLFGSVPAQVKITPIPKLSDGERAIAFLKGLFEFIGEGAEPSLTEESERIVIQIDAPSAKKLIGRRGETIDAIQTLASAVANIGREEYIRVVVDCGNYREDREETLKHVAEKTAAKAIRLGKRIRLEPMNPYERRIIHAALMENDAVTTKSEGKEPSRYVVITPKELKNDRSRDRDRNRRNGNRGGNGRDRYGKGDFNKKREYPHRELPKEASPQTAGTSLSRGTSGGYKKGNFTGFFGTYLGNSRDEQPETEVSPTETPDE